MNFQKLLSKYRSRQYPPMLPSDIKAIRYSFNLSQTAFAKLLEINLDTLQNYEVGRTKTPSTAVALFTLAKEHPTIFLERQFKKFDKKPRTFMR